MHVFIVKRKRADGKLETLTRRGVLACFIERKAADDAAKAIGGFVVPQEAEVQKVEEYVLVQDSELQSMKALSVEISK